MYHDQLNDQPVMPSLKPSSMESPLHHPVNLAYEAKDCRSRRCQYDRSLPPQTYGETTVNYNRDIEIFPVLKRMLERILGNLPTLLQQTWASTYYFAIVDNDAIGQM